MRKAAVGALLLAAAAVLLALTPPGQRALEKAGRWLVVTTPVQRADLIVALGGDRARQEKAVELYRRGLAPFIVFTGADARERDYGCLGLPPEAALPVPAPVFTTNAEADSVGALVAKNRYGSVLIVTSPYHSRRALAVFRREFRGKPVQVEIAGCDPPAFLAALPWWKSRMGVKTIVTEYLGLLYYGIRGWI